MLQQRSIKKVAFFLVIAAFVSATFFGASHLGMDAQMGGQMGPCPLMPGVVVCNMTSLQHMAAAQITFTALPQSSDILLLLLILLTSAIVAAVLSKIFLVQPQSEPLRSVSRRECVPFSRFFEAFFDGIIHSKVF